MSFEASDDGDSGAGILGKSWPAIFYGGTDSATCPAAAEN
jgi:hypothetical protein